MGRWTHGEGPSGRACHADPRDTLTLIGGRITVRANFGMVNWPVDERPMVVIWEATRACQLACRHCRASAQRKPLPGELDTAAALGLIDQVEALHPAIFVITGGDPLERADLGTLVAHSHSVGLRTFLAPSATPLLTPQAVEAAAVAGCAGFQLSLDGATASTHDRFRGIGGTFDRTVDAARWIRERSLPLSIATTVTRDNAEELPAIAEQVATLGAGMWSVFFLVPTGRGRRQPEVDAGRAEEILGWLLEASHNLPFRVKTTEAPQIRRLATRAGSPAATAGIGDGRGFAFIAYNGDVWPSGFLPLTAGNIRGQSLAEIYRTSQLFRELRSPEALRGPHCGRCPHRAICGGSRSRAFAHTGDPLGDDPLCAFVPDGEMAAVD